MPCCEEVQTKRDQIDVAGALAVAQQAAFDTIGTGKHGQLGGGHAHALIVVRVQRQHHGVARHQIVRHVFHLIGEHVRSGHFHRCRQIDDHRMLRSRLDDVDHRIAHLNGVLRLGAGEGFRRILVIQVDALGLVFKVLAQLGRVGGELLECRLYPCGTRPHAAARTRSYRSARRRAWHPSGTRKSCESGAREPASAPRS